MPRTEGEAELRKHQRIQQEVKELGLMIDDSSKARASENHTPIVALKQDMWLPYFKAGATCKVKFAKCEQVKHGQFVLVRHGEHVRVVRFISWKFLDGRTVLYFIPGPTVRRVVSSSSVELVGVVLTVTDPASNKEIDPNKTNIFLRIWNEMTTYGTGGFWVGLYRFADSIVIDFSSLRHEKKRHSEGVLQTWHKLESWRREAERRRKAEEASKRKKSRKPGWNEVELDREASEGFREDDYDEVKKKLNQTSDAEMAKWWTQSERQEVEKKSTRTAYHRHNHQRWGT